MTEEMYTEAGFESINAFGSLIIIRYFIPQSAPSLCKISTSVSRVNVGIK